MAYVTAGLYRHTRHNGSGEKRRLFELCCYESAGESAGRAKIDLFNDVGEIVEKHWRRQGIYFHSARANAD